MFRLHFMRTVLFQKDWIKLFFKNLRCAAGYRNVSIKKHREKERDIRQIIGNIVMLTV